MSSSRASRNGESFLTEDSPLVGGSNTEARTAAAKSKILHVISYCIMVVALSTFLLLCMSNRNNIKARDYSSLPSTENTMLMAKSNSLKQEAIAKNAIRCDDILIGAWVETCLIASKPDGVFPGMQGILSYPLLMMPAQDGGFDYYGYSLREPFFGNQHYWEMGHGQPSRVASPSPTQHCISNFKSKLRLSNSDKWDDDDGYYVWNRVSHDTIMVGNGKDAACHFERLYGNTCREVRSTAIKHFAKVNISISLPSEEELCG